MAKSKKTTTKTKSNPIPKNKTKKKVPTKKPISKTNSVDKLQPKSKAFFGWTPDVPDNRDMMFSLPHWIWAAVSAYFDTSKSPAVGGFTGLHLLLIVITFLVFNFPAPESANGWFIYYLGAPIVITVGALLGNYITLWKKSK